MAAIAPAYANALFVRRPCRRTLRYLGYTWDDSTPPADDDFFKLGGIYVATSFNGGTYEIEGYQGEVIGCAYFELVA